jgi:hypothetical protein
VKMSRSIVGPVCLLVVLIAFSIAILRPARVMAQSSAESSVVQQDGDHIMVSEKDSAEVKIGFRIAPVRLTFRAADRELVGLGSYIVNAQGACNDCHTNPPFKPTDDPFQGRPGKVNKANYLAGGMAFGPFVSRNLTPEANGLPAGLTYAEFAFVLRTGIDLDQAHPMISPFLQVMPWPIYRNMQDHDLRAIYAYLKAIPSASPAPGSPEAP